METHSWVTFVCNIHISTKYTQFMYVDKNRIDLTHHDDKYVFIYIFNLQPFVFTVCKHKYTLYIYIFSIHDMVHRVAAPLKISSLRSSWCLFGTLRGQL